MTEVNIEISGELEVPPNDTSPPPYLKILQMGEVPRATEWIQQRRQNVRPWLQFGQTANFKLPQSLPRLARRLTKNIEYFQSNYIFVFLILIVYCLVTSPLLLLAVSCSLYAGYRLSKRQAENKKLVAFGHELTLVQQYAALTVCSMPIFYLAGAGAAVFWVLGASFFLIGLHASFYNIDVDDELSFLQNV
ncbi:hypothetical protein FQA39_LY14280 [Lamprigera yunnana]|nr:hypothetical protein FQA39_LY14280 [Lamprigera yunnana]